MTSKLQRKRSTRRPPTPGEVLDETILKADPPITQGELADAMRMSRFSINQIVVGKRGITAETALRLGTVTGTSPVFWLNLQREIDLYDARADLKRRAEKLTTLRTPLSESDLIRDDGSF